MTISYYPNLGLRDERILMQRTMLHEAEYDEIQDRMCTIGSSLIKTYLDIVSMFQPCETLYIRD